MLLFGLRSPAPSAPRLMPPVAPPLGTAVTVAAGAAVAIGSELAAQFGDKFLLCCRSWNTKEECEALLSGALLITHSGDAWALAEGEAVGEDADGMPLPSLRGMGQGRIEVGEAWLAMNIDVLIPAALGSFPPDRSQGAAFGGSAFEARAVWVDDDLVGIRVTIGLDVHEGAVGAYVDQRINSLVKLLWPNVGSLWNAEDGLGWARASLLDIGMEGGTPTHAMLGGARFAAAIRSCLPERHAGLLLAGLSPSGCYRSVYDVARALEVLLCTGLPQTTPGRTDALAVYLLGLVSAAFPATWVRLVPGFADAVSMALTNHADASLLSVLETRLAMLSMPLFAAALAASQQFGSMLRRADRWSQSPPDRVAEVVNLLSSELLQAFYDQALEPAPAMQPHVRSRELALDGYAWC